MERTLNRNEKEYKNMMAVAKMLEALSPNGAGYVVKDVYLDFGQNWMWTTICRTGFKECQVLSPREWRTVTLADTAEDLMKAVEEIRAGQFFGDR